MGRLTTRSEYELQEHTLDALDTTRVNGTLAPVYLQIANSEVALRAYLKMEEALRNGGLTLKEVEAIKLLVSQHNLCAYCLSAHTVKSRLAGIELQEQIAIRKGEQLADQRLNAILQATAQLLKRPGTFPEEQLQSLRDAGVDEQQMVDIALAISTTVFLNMCNNFNDTKLPFAPAPSID